MSKHEIYTQYPKREPLGEFRTDVLLSSVVATDFPSTMFSVFDSQIHGEIGNYDLKFSTGCISDTFPPPYNTLPTPESEGHESPTGGFSPPRYSFGQPGPSHSQPGPSDSQPASSRNQPEPPAKRMKMETSVRGLNIFSNDDATIRRNPSERHEDHSYVCDPNRHEEEQKTLQRKQENSRGKYSIF